MLGKESPIMMVIKTGETLHASPMADAARALLSLQHTAIGQSGVNPETNPQPVPAAAEIPKLISALQAELGKVYAFIEAKAS